MKLLRHLDTIPVRVKPLIQTMMSMTVISSRVSEKAHQEPIHMLLMVTTNLRLGTHIRVSGKPIRNTALVFRHIITSELIMDTGRMVQDTEKEL